MYLHVNTFEDARPEKLITQRQKEKGKFRASWIRPAHSQAHPEMNESNGVANCNNAKSQNRAAQRKHPYVSRSSDRHSPREWVAWIDPLLALELVELLRFSGCEIQ